MKNDARLKQDVEAELSWDPSLNHATIRVDASNGVVTLTGHVATCAERHCAELAVQRVAGVRAIAVDLDVRLAPDHVRSDTDIAKAALNALQWNAQVGEGAQVDVDQIQVVVQDGWLTLRGEVAWEYQRRAAAEAVRALVGVKGVSNLIAVMPRSSPSELRSQILDSFKRQVEREVERLDISIEAGTVTLCGTVDSWHERDAAQSVAWSAPGVCAVRNKLTIA